MGGFVNAVTRERLSFAQVKEHSTHLSTALVRRYGLQTSDTVSIFSPNTIWYPVAMFAVLRVGGRVNGASPAYSVDEMSHAVQTAEAKFIMTIPSSIKVALAAAEKSGIPKSRIFLLDGMLDGFVSVKQLIDWGRELGSEAQVPFFRIAAGKTNDICGYLNFSSGTTGLPKAVR
jgi:4-coumarate--CoA ligase